MSQFARYIKRTHLYETIGGITVPKVCNSKGFTARDGLHDLFLPNFHSEESDGMLLCTIWICYILTLVEL